MQYENNRLRSATAFFLSAAVHGFVLAWVSLAPMIPPARPSIYEQEIKPYESQIVWYNLKERLPDIAPTQADRRTARARVQSRQTVVAGPAEMPRPPQLIWTPAPEIETRQILPAPNVVALTPAPRPVRDFQLPPTPVHTQPAPAALPEAPQVGNVKLAAVAVSPPTRLPPRPFAPPEVAHASTPRPENLPAAPTIEARSSGPLPLTADPPRVLRPFAAPATEHAHLERPEGLPAAPQIATEVSAAALPEIKAAPVLRPFAVPRPGVAVTPAAPLADAPDFNDRPAEAALAIVGLFPAREVPIPKPQSSQKAGFSTGPQPHAEGGDAGSDPILLTVPGLLVRNDTSDSRPNLVAVLAPPTSRANLDAAARSVQVTAAGRTLEPQATRLTAVPDPRMAGRVIYRIAIQMPNVSSYSGSWIVWFAERDPVQDQPVSDMRAPAPLRKVDPKYTAAAWDEKVEGKVRLAAVIRKDGHVDRVELLQHLDNRLDQSSQEALAKWEFEPALRNGVAIDVDAVFEIPFHLAPKVPNR